MDKKKYDDIKIDSLSLSPKGNREQGIGNRERKVVVGDMGGMGGV
ncbi:hypothetical protein [Moorena bouillonii]|nr:hypothetical protein [Moorena bouillonii]